MMASEDKNQSDVILEIMAKNRPDEAIKKLAAYLRKITNSDEVAIYYTRRIKGEPCLVKLPYTDTTSSADNTEILPQLNYRPLFSIKGVCEWVLKNDRWLYGNSLHEANEHGYVSFTGEHRNVKLRPSIAKDWNQSTDTDKEAAIAFVPMHWLNTSNMSHPNAVLSFWKMPDNKTPYFNKVDMENAIELSQMIQICCQHVLKIYQTIYQEDVLHKLMLNLEKTDSPDDAVFHGLQSIANIVDTKFCVVVEKIDYEKFNESCTYISRIFINDSEKTAFSRAESLLKSFSFISEHENTINNKELKRRLTHELTRYNLRSKTDLRLILRDPLKIDSHSTIVFIDTTSDENFNSSSAGILPEPKHISKLLERLKVLLQMHLLKSIRRLIRSIKNKSLDTTNIYQNSLEVLANVTGCDYAILYLIETPSEVKLFKYDRKKGMIFEQSLFNEKTFVKTLTWESIQKNEHYYIPDISNQNTKIGEKLNRKFLEELIDEDLEAVKSWLCYPFGYYEKDGDRIGVGAIKLIGTKSKQQLSTTSIRISRAISDFIFHHHRENIRLESLKSINKIANNLSRYSGRILSDEIVKSLEQWSLRFLRGQHYVLLNATDSMGKLLYGVSEPLEKESVYILNHSEREHNNTIKLFGTIYYHHISQLTNSGIKELGGILIFLSKSPFLSEHRRLIDEVAIDISTLICQEHLRNKRTRELTRFKHAIIAPVGAIESSALALKRLIKNGKIEDEDKELFQKCVVSISRETESIANWTKLSRILGRDDVAQISLQKQSISRLIKNCIDRYSDIALARNIRFSILEENSLVSFYFDPFALDIAISNIIDNAVKYAYYNTIINVTYGRVRGIFYLKVIDIGHGIPEDFEKEYKEGKHLTWQDPYRIIAGGGYGISIINSLIKAHSGTFKLTSSEVTKVKKETQRHEVVARIELPYVL